MRKTVRVVGGSYPVVGKRLTHILINNAMPGIPKLIVLRKKEAHKLK